MQVQLLKHWRGWKPGQVFCDMPAGQATLLLKRSVAVQVEGDEAKRESPCKASPPPRKSKPKR